MMKWDSGRITGFVLKSPHSATELHFQFPEPLELGATENFSIEWAAGGVQLYVHRASGTAERHAVTMRVEGDERAGVQFIPMIQDEGDKVRCWRCHKKMAVILTRPWEVDCVRCHATNRRNLQDP